MKKDRVRRLGRGSRGWYHGERVEWEELSGRGWRMEREWSGMEGAELYCRKVSGVGKDLGRTGQGKVGRDRVGNCSTGWDSF